MKKRYEILDGLRGVAALMVVWFHIFEGFATSAIDQRCNHGYLAVDFFFILSGFVVGYAFGQVWYVAIGIFIGLPILAYAVLKYYDEPLRKWLGHR